LSEKGSLPATSPFGDNPGDYPVTLATAIKLLFCKNLILKYLF
jgi:hypothetical protein